MSSERQSESRPPALFEDVCGPPDDPRPVLSGYETPLPVHNTDAHDTTDTTDTPDTHVPDGITAEEYRKLRQRKANPKRVISDATREKQRRSAGTRQALRNKHSLRSHFSTVPRHAQLVTDENGGKRWWEWIDEETGETKRRRARRDLGSKKRSPGGTSYKQLRRELNAAALTQQHKGDDDTSDESDVRADMRGYWLEIEASYRQFYNVASSSQRRPSRSTLHSWARFVRCGGIPSNGQCPICSQVPSVPDTSPKSIRLAWVARPKDKPRRVICRSCNDCLKAGGDDAMCRALAAARLLGLE